MRIFITISLLFLLVNFCFAQTPTVKEFKVNRIDNTVVVEWTIFSGFQCSDVEVHHGLDSTNFNIIHIEYGICGSDTADESYAFFHRNPAAQEKEYYRIKVGFDEFSKIKELTNENLEPFSLYPNPSFGELSYTYFNPDFRAYDIRIYDMKGNLHYEQLGIKSSGTGNIDLTGLMNGNLLFTLWQNGETRHQQKLIKIAQ